MVEALLLIIIAIMLFGASAVASRVAGFFGHVIAAIVLIVIAANMGISAEVAFYAVLSVPFVLILLLPIIKILERWEAKRFDEALKKRNSGGR